MAQVETPNIVCHTLETRQHTHFAEYIERQLFGAELTAFVLF